MTLILHGYWRSGTSYRTRIALNLKGLAYETRAVDLRHGAQADPAYRALNPQGLVPALEADGRIIIQSLAIMEWLEEHYPAPPLLPPNAAERAIVRAMTLLLACDVHPLNNLRVLRSLKGQFQATQDQIDAWAGHWITEGFAALETLIDRHGDGFCYGDRPGFVDCALVPQVYSAQRFKTDLSAFPRIRAVANACEALPGFVAAHPDRQIDADPAAV